MKRTVKYILILIAIIGLLVYINSFYNGFVGDDDYEIIKNPLIQSLTNIPKFFLGGTFFNGDIAALSGNYYRPLKSLTFAFLYAIGGANPFFFHSFQALVHIANAILLFLIFRYFFNMYIAGFLSLIFLVHPINAESVSYISDMQDVLFFFFGSVGLWLQLRLKPSLKKTFLISFCFLLTLFSKESGLLFVVMVLVYQWFLSRKEFVRTALGSLGSIGLYLVLRLGVAHVVSTAASFAPIGSLSFAMKLMQLPAIVFYYLRTFVAPGSLAIGQVWTVRDIAGICIPLFLDLVFVAGLVWLGKKVQKAHQKNFHFLLFFSFWFVSGLFFHLNLVFPLDMTVADRWFYFPFVGLLGMMGIVLATYSHHFTKKHLVLAGIIIAVLSIRTVMRNSNFYDNYTLFSHDVVYSPHSSALESGFAFELIKKKQYKKAEKYILASVADDPKGSVNWNIYGLLYERMGRLDKAKRGYQTAVHNSRYYLAYQNYVLFLFLYDKPEEAEKFTKQAIHDFPTGGDLWMLFALIENNLGHKKEALAASRNAAMLLPNQLTYTIYTRISQNQPLTTNIINSPTGKQLGICPPMCK